MTNKTIMTNKQTRRIATLGLGALTAACLTVPVGPAYGAEPTSVWVENGVLLRVLSPAGQNNTIELSPRQTPAGLVIDVSDSTGTVSAQAPCAVIDPHRVSCAAIGIRQFSVDTGDGNDSIRNFTDLRGGIFTGAGDDTVFDGNGPQTIVLGTGDDTVRMGSGSDLVGGGPGTDTVVYERTAPVIVDLDGVADDGEAGEHDDVQVDVEVVFGGAGNDTLVGNPAANALHGGFGNDLVRGLGGNDVVDGGSGADNLFGDDGTDTSTYEDRSAGVVVTLDDMANDGPSGENDNAHSDIENITGGRGADFLFGTAGSNVLRGQAGDDHLSAGDGNDVVDGGAGDDLIEDSTSPDHSVDGAGTGADTMSGGPGTDTVDYSRKTTGVIVRLDDLVNDGQAGEHDNTHTDIENILGTNSSDDLIGSAANNVIDGFAGNDLEHGLGGNDVLGGDDAGADNLFGGTGTDTADYGFRTRRRHGPAGQPGQRRARRRARQRPHRHREHPRLPVQRHPGRQRGGQRDPRARRQRPDRRTVRQRPARRRGRARLPVRRYRGRHLDLQHPRRAGRGPAGQPVQRRRDRRERQRRRHRERARRRR